VSAKPRRLTRCLWNTAVGVRGAGIVWRPPEPPRRPRALWQKPKGFSDGFGGLPPEIKLRRGVCRAGGRGADGGGRRPRLGRGLANRVCTVHGTSYGQVISANDRASMGGPRRRQHGGPAAGHRYVAWLNGPAGRTKGGQTAAQSRGGGETPIQSGAPTGPDDGAMAGRFAANRTSQ